MMFWPRMSCIHTSATKASNGSTKLLHLGGDLKPQNSPKEGKLSTIVDSHKREEQQSSFFDALSSPTEKEPLVNKGSTPIYTEKILQVNKGSVSLFDPYCKNEACIDTSIDPRDSYSGYSQLYLWRYDQPIVASRIPFVPRQRHKEDYSNIWYPHNQFPPAKASKVELPTREKKTEPVQDPVPRVKGIRGTPPKVQHNKKKRVQPKCAIEGE